jgi:hypothetical protein
MLPKINDRWEYKLSNGHTLVARIVVVRSKFDNAFRWCIVIDEPRLEWFGMPPEWDSVDDVANSARTVLKNLGFVRASAPAEKEGV